MKSCVPVAADFVKTGGTDGANYSLADHPVDRGVETHLVAYNRYEADGLAVQEALCCGLPTFVTHDAGIAEQYAPSLQHLLVKEDAKDDLDLAERLKASPARPGIFRSEQAALAANPRAHAWADLAAQFAGTVQNRR